MKRNRGRIPILLGLLLIVAALSLAAYNVYDGQRAGQTASRTAERLEELIPAAEPPEPATLPAQAPAAPQATAVPDYALNPEMEMPAAELDGADYIGTLQIPALELNLPVISQWSYDNLKIAPCRYAGSAYLDDLVIAAHNYGGHFGALKDLSPGDAVTFTDMDGNVFAYEVSALETLPPTAVEEMTTGVYALTLFTCTVGGQSRVAVRCDRAEPEGQP